MKTFKTQRRLASEVLGVGKNKVWFDSSRLKDIADALTKADMEELIKDGAIKARQSEEKKGKVKKRKRGSGSIRKKTNRRKQDYIRKIRKLRAYIKHLRNKGAVTKAEFYELRKMAKAGQFRNKRHLKEYLGDVLKSTQPSQAKKKQKKN